jgi:hypothetical protein
LELGNRALFFGNGCCIVRINAAARKRSRRRVRPLQKNADPGIAKQPPVTFGQAREKTMRKLRRLPWRIPKNHHAQPPVVSAEACPREPQRETHREAQREAQRELLNSQPVAFAGGRYVYGEAAPSVARPARSPEIRRKVRHHAILPVPVAG